MNDEEKKDMQKLFPALPDWDLARMREALQFPGVKKPTPQESAYYFGYLTGLISRLCHQLDAANGIMSVVTKNIEEQNRCRICGGKFVFEYPNIWKKYFSSTEK